MCAGRRRARLARRPSRASRPGTSRSEPWGCVSLAVTERAKRRGTLVLVVAEEHRLGVGARRVDSVGDACEQELEVLQPQDIEALRVRVKEERACA